MGRPKNKIRAAEVVHCLFQAIQHFNSRQRKTDLAGTARNFSGRRVPRERFEELMDMKVSDIVKVLKDDETT